MTKSEADSWIAADEAARVAAREARPRVDRNTTTDEPGSVAMKLLATLSGVEARSASEWQARCPAHDDDKASLSVTDVGDKVLIYCHAGCTSRDVVDAIGWELKDLFEKRAAQAPIFYPYTDEHGKLLYSKVRMDLGDGKKDFYYVRPNGGIGIGSRRVPYRLAEIVNATDVLYIVEGEKDVESLEALGVVATNSKDWQVEWSQYVKAQTVLVIPDNDEAGTKIANKVLAALPGSRLLHLDGVDVGGDVTDWLAAGHTVEELRALSPVAEGPVDTEYDDEQERLEAQQAQEERWELDAATDPSWMPASEQMIDLVASGEIQRPVPTVLTRSDGVALLYQGRVNMFLGESESCKTWAALCAVVQEIDAGNHAMIVDYEDVLETAVERLMQMGLTRAQLRERLIYINPQGQYGDAAIGWLETQCRWKRPTVAVVDSVTDAMTLEGLDPDRGREVNAFYRSVPRLLAKRGVAVVLIDHVTKSSGGRWAIGSERKISGLDGVAYAFTAKEPFGRGKTGIVDIKVSKDRGGSVREWTCNKNDMGTLRLVSDPQTKQITFVVEKPREKGAADQVRDVAVTIVQTKGRVLEVIRETQGQTRGEIRDAAAMNRTAMDAALNELLQEGSVLERKNSRRVEYFVPTN